MSSKGQRFSKSSLPQCMLAIIIVGTSVSWASATTLAQAVPLKTPAPSTWWSLEDRGLHTSPHLVIGMADRKDTLAYDSLRRIRDETANPSAKNTIRRQILPSSPEQAGATAYSLLDDGPALRSFSYRYQTEAWLTDSASFSSEVDHSPLPPLAPQARRLAIPCVSTLGCRGFTVAYPWWRSIPQPRVRTTQIEFVRTGTICNSSPEETVLEIAEMNALSIPYGCRHGTCATCATKLLSGNVRMEREEGLSEDLKVQGYILPCIS